METWCDHCHKYTNYICTTMGHERDSSQDYEECLECHWYAYGMSGEYNKPTDFNDKIRLE